MRGWALALAVMCVAGCGESENPAGGSLVGAEQLPPVTKLARETIWISRGFGGGYGYGTHRLLYELRPDDRLVVTYTEAPQSPEQEADRLHGRDTFRLPQDQAAQARRALWRLRPERLEGMDTVTHPRGCQPSGPHDLGEIVVAFTDDNAKGGSPEAQAGTVDLPRPKSCDTREAAEARALVQALLDRFPRSAVAAKFEEAEAADAGES